MAQISRPFQLALAGVALLGVVWFFVLRSHPPASVSSSSPPPAAPAPAPKPTVAQATKAATPSNSALKGAVTAANNTVKTSQHQANPVSHTSAATAGGTLAPAATHAAQRSHAAPVVTKVATHRSVAKAAPKATVEAATKPVSKAHAPAVAKPVRHATSTAVAKPVKSAPHRAVAHKVAPSVFAPALAIKNELHHGKTAVVLFWNPKSSDDREVRQQLSGIGNEDGHVAVHIALPSQVTQYGTITADISILQTPTLVIINPKGQETTVSGLVDSTDIRQAISQAESAGA